MDPTPTFLPVVPLTPSGRPIHLPSEIELSILSPIDLDPEENPSLPSLKATTLILTSHRLLFILNSASSARALSLAAVVHAFPPKKSLKSMFASPRVRIQVLNGSRSEILTLVLRGGKGDLDGFFEKLWEAMRAKAWTVTAAAEEVRREVEEAKREETVRIRVPVVGVSGILRKEQEIWESTDKSLQEAFQDLNALMVFPSRI